MKTAFTPGQLVELLAKLYVREVLKDNAVLTRRWLGEKWESFNDTACARSDGTKGRITNEAGVEAECVLTEIVISESAGDVQVSFAYRTVFPAPPEPEPVVPAKKHK